MSESATSTTGPGRPRDAEVDRKALRAAIELYAELGWAKFTLDAVVRRAGIGKAAVYRRWPGRERLIADAVEWALVSPAIAIDTGDLREDLRELARSMMAHYLGPYGLAGLRLHVEARAYPALFAGPSATIRRSRVLEARAIIRRAIARGELGEHASPTLILDTLLGGVLNHVLATPEELRAEMAARSDRYVEDLTEFVLTAARAIYPPPGRG
ncbi:AcrR family transcriptional regulator [Thermocatellispora tengchongensis]|uniref:AcrR family transcriptional regulator n=2 Tax=Thermocatellispora tengchongensis TaxID=1073253 RepID=A0A840P298_9ACTN|nr:TetR/AcrR family transcriptional regulator [Thermocatellispora tengchongensis]MBB5133482.1 AcrR family transcriptional regulator [Thermocatellispora tengchongensis]